MIIVISAVLGIFITVAYHRKSKSLDSLTLDRLYRNWTLGIQAVGMVAAICFAAASFLIANAVYEFESTPKILGTLTAFSDVGYDDTNEDDVVQFTATLFNEGAIPVRVEKIIVENEDGEQNAILPAVVVSEVKDERFNSFDDGAIIQPGGSNVFRVRLEGASAGETRYHNITRCFAVDSADRKYELRVEPIVVVNNKSITYDLSFMKPGESIAIEDIDDSRVTIRD